MLVEREVGASGEVEGESTVFFDNPRTRLAWSMALLLLEVVKERSVLLDLLLTGLVHECMPSCRWRRDYSGRRRGGVHLLTHRTTRGRSEDPVSRGWCGAMGWVLAWIRREFWRCRRTVRDGKLVVLVTSADEDGKGVESSDLRPCGVDLADCSPRRRRGASEEVQL